MGDVRLTIPDEIDSGFVLDRELDGDIPRILREPATVERAPMAGGTIGPGHVVYDDVRQDHLATDPSRVREMHRPPGEWTATDEEMDTVVDWTNERISAQDRLRRDNTLKFLTTYSAERSKEVARLQTSTASRPGAFRREEESNYRWARSGPQVLERAEIAPEVGGGPSPRPTEGVEPSLLGVPRVPMLPGETQAEAQERARQMERIAAEDREDTRTRARMATRERLTRISGWLERPEILGVQGLSSEVYGNVESAYVYVVNNMPHLSEVEDLNVMAGTDQVTVRNLFARLSANMAGHADFLNLPVTALDRTGDRFRLKIIEILMQLSQWQYDSRRGEFTKRTLDEVRREVDASYDLPPVGGRVF